MAKVTIPSLVGNTVRIHGRSKPTPPPIDDPTPPEGARRRTVRIINESGEAIQAGYILRINGILQDGRRQFFRVGKTTTTFSRRFLVAARDVPNGTPGRAYLMTEECDVQYEGGTPALGEQWGPKPGSWKLNSGYYGFEIQGLASTGFVCVIGEPVTLIEAKTTAAHAKGATQACTIYVGESASAFSTIQVKNRFANLTSGKWIIAQWAAGWKATAGEC